MKMSDDILMEAVPNASWLVHSPGVIRILGDHADFTGGVVLSAAIDRYVKIAVSPRNDDVVMVHALKRPWGRG